MPGWQLVGQAPRRGELFRVRCFAGKFGLGSQPMYVIAARVGRHRRVPRRRGVGSGR